jgi:hypothetical protein
MAEAVQRYHNQREIVTMARFLARKEVRQHWKEQGRRPYDYSQKELCEAADELIRAKPELIGLARIAVEGLRGCSKQTPR